MKTNPPWFTRLPKKPRATQGTASRVQVALLLSAVAGFSALASLQAQSVPAVPAAAPAKEEESTIVLSPFEVTADQDNGYMARNTLGGTRLNTSLRDVASQVSIMTPEFLEDIAATNLEDTFRYSLNVEGLEEFQSPTGGGGDFADGVVNSKVRSRVRGLTNGSLTHDFFNTDYSLDTYNTERFTFASGPNAILFGLGSPAGVTDGGYKRARTTKLSGSASVRVDSNDSVRSMFDLNVPLLPRKLALRASYLHEEAKEWRKPAGSSNRRFFLTTTWEPTRSTRVRVWYEDILIDRYPARSMIVRDAITPWINAGKPLFDNSGITPATGSSTVTARLTAANQLALFTRFGNANPVLSIGQSANGVTVMRWTSTVTTRGPEYSLTLPDKNPQTLKDASVFPNDVSVNGTGTRNIQDGWIAGAVVEQSFFNKLFFEAGYNKERRYNPWTDLIRGTQSSIQADVNKYLPDGVTPNPNVGRYFVQGVGQAALAYSERDSKRITASYDLDLTRRSKWLGRHRFAGLIGQDITIEEDPYQGAVLTIINNTPLTTGTPETELRNANRALWVRSYVDDPRDPKSQGIYWAQLPFDAMRGYTTPDGTQIASHYNPYGMTGNGGLAKSLEKSRMLVAQSHWLSDRLVTTMGWRRTNLKDVSIRPSVLGTGNAPYQSILDLRDEFPEYTNSVTGGTRTLAVVAHPFKWLSVHYNESNSFAPGDQGHNPDDTVVPGAHGKGSDKGFTLAPFGDRVYLRANFYEQTAGPVGGGSFQNAIRSPVMRLEETAVELYGEQPHATYDHNLGGNYYVVTSNRKSEGLELELIANPTPSWRVSLGAAKANAIQSQIAPAWLAFVKERAPVWGKYADQLMLESQRGTVLQNFREIVDDLNLMLQTEGAKVESGREWRINGTTRYTFRNGWLKGSFIGANGSYRSRNVVGYRYSMVPNQFPFPGLGDTIEAPDINQPVYGSPLVTIDGMAGYSRKLFRGKVTWRVQLNVRNLLNTRDIIEQSVYSDGTLRQFDIMAPRLFILTNTFTF